MPWGIGIPNAVEPITGNTMFFYGDNGSPTGARVSLAQILISVGIGSVAYNADAATASKTLTAAEISGGLQQTILAMTGTFGAGGALTLPTVAALEATDTNLAVGSTYILRVINEGPAGTGTGQTLTMTTNTGWTLVGTMTLVTASFRDFLVTINSATTATLQDIGGGALVTE